MLLLKLSLSAHNNIMTAVISISASSRDMFLDMIAGTKYIVYSYDHIKDKHRIDFLLDDIQLIVDFRYDVASTLGRIG